MDVLQQTTPHTHTPYHIPHTPYILFLECGFKIGHWILLGDEFDEHVGSTLTFRGRRKDRTKSSKRTRRKTWPRAFYSYIRCPTKWSNKASNLYWSKLFPSILPDEIAKTCEISQLIFCCKETRPELLSHTDRPWQKHFLSCNIKLTFKMTTAVSAKVPA